MVRWVYIEYSEPVFYREFFDRGDLQRFIDARVKSFKWTYYPVFDVDCKQMSLFDY